MSDRNKSLGGYERRLKPEKIPINRRIWLGEDSLEGDSLINSWASSKVYMYGQYEFLLMPTHGQTLGARNELIEWDRPTSLNPTTEWRIKDYDQDLLDQLIEWQAASTQLRLYVWGLFWVRCRIANIPITAPYKDETKITTSNRQLYIYAGGLASPMWDDTDSQESYNNPFLADELYGYLYGSLGAA